MSLRFPLRALAAAIVLACAGLHAATPAGTYQNPVRAGDFPDPSVIIVNGEYWATATSSEWAPHFPLLHSKDLVNWEVKGHVFDKPPAWARANFWAPEISAHNGKFFIYYTARQQNGPLAVAVATADHPGGPYTDHGFLVSQDPGSIDGMAFTDAKGARWLVWKEDGNSKKIPTILWLQRLTDDGLKLTGDRREIMRNDAPWEGAVVEGPFVLRRGDWYYLFYAGGACCGRNCNYAVGVARAKDPLGPWEKAPSNPIMAQNDAWRCPGHGSLVTDPQGRIWFLYHAYASKGFVATGREMLLDEVVFGADGWPTINGGKGPSTQARAPAKASAQKDLLSFREEFNGSGALAPGWQWPIARQPVAKIGGGRLTLTATDEPATAVQSIIVPSFVAETSVVTGSISPGTFAGLVVFGDRVNQLALVTDGKKIQVWNQRRGDRTTVTETDAVSAAVVRLRIACIDGNKFRFAVQGSTGAWKELAAETDGSFLPPWDRGVRTGLLVSGPKNAAGSFDYFTTVPDDGKLFAP